MTHVKNDLEMDGIQEVPQVDFHTFPAKLNKVNFSLIVTIPSEIVHKLRLTPEHYVQIAIRQITEEQAINEFGFTTKRGRAKQVMCPSCNKIGSLHKSSRGLPWVFLSVMHHKMHGFKEKTTHGISRKHKRFYKEHLSNKAVAEGLVS